MGGASLYQHALVLTGHSNDLDPCMHYPSSIQRNSTTTMVVERACNQVLVLT